MALNPFIYANEIFNQTFLALYLHNLEIFIFLDATLRSYDLNPFKSMRSSILLLCMILPKFIIHFKGLRVQMNKLFC